MQGFDVVHDDTSVTIHSGTAFIRFSDRIPPDRNEHLKQYIVEWEHLSGSGRLVIYGEPLAQNVWQVHDALDKLLMNRRGSSGWSDQGYTLVIEASSDGKGHTTLTLQTTESTLERLGWGGALRVQLDEWTLSRLARALRNFIGRDGL